MISLGDSYIRLQLMHLLSVVVDDERVLFLRAFSRKKKKHTNVFYSTCYIGYIYSRYVFSAILILRGATHR